MCVWGGQYKTSSVKRISLRNKLKFKSEVRGLQEEII